MFIKYLGYTIITILVCSLTFFGLGPVVFADGSMQERLGTLGVVLVLYVILGWLLVYWVRRNRKSK